MTNPMTPELPPDHESTNEEQMDPKKKQKLQIGGALALIVVAIVAANLLQGDDAASEGGDTLASIGDMELTDAEFAAYLRFRRVSLRGEEQSERVLDEYIEREALAQAIERSGDLDHALIQAELNEQRKEALIARYFDQFLTAAVTDDGVRQFYETHASEYEDRKVHVGHVLVRTSRRMTDEERQAALTKAREAYSRLEAGDEFSAVATQYSEDRVTASRGGDLGWVREGSISPRFSETAFSLELGSYAEPFETPFGYHIVTVLEAPQTVRRPLSAVEGEIRARLRQESKEAEVERLRGLIETDVREGGFEPPASAPRESVAGTAAQNEEQG